MDYFTPPLSSLGNTTQAFPSRISHQFHIGSTFSRELRAWRRPNWGCLWNNRFAVCRDRNASAKVTATQAMYDLFAYLGKRHQLAAVHRRTWTVVAGLPGSCFPSCATINGKVTPYFFYSPQFSSLYAWRSIGNSAYNAGQFSLRRSMTRGLEFDLNYTYSKSMDIGLRCRTD